jgi:small subunit ribosomal protein S20
MTRKSISSRTCILLHFGLKAMKNAEPELMQAAQRNIIHRNNASRKVSRLTHAIAKLAK